MQLSREPQYPTRDKSCPTTLHIFRHGYELQIIFEFVNLDTNDAIAGQWEIFGTLMNGGTLLIRTSNWEEVLKRVSEPCHALTYFLHTLHYDLEL